MKTCKLSVCRKVKTRRQREEAETKRGKGKIRFVYRSLKKRSLSLTGRLEFDSISKFFPIPFLSDIVSKEGRKRKKKKEKQMEREVEERKSLPSVRLSLGANIFQRTCLPFQTNLSATDVFHRREKER